MSELNKEIKDGIRKRIALLLERTNMDKTTFAQAVNMSQSAVSSLLGGRYDPSLNTVLLLHEKFPEISIEWLLYGKGDDPFQDKDADSLQDLFSSGTESSRDDVKDEASPGRTIASCGNVMEKAPMPPQKKITEIRVFYDDNTFDVFFHAK